jgi:hypothetical protein
MSSLKYRPVFTLILVIATSFKLTSCRSPQQIEILPGIDNELVMSVVLPYAINLQHDMKLKLEESTVHYGGNGTYIAGMCLSFTSQSILELREARGMLVDIAEGLLESVNTDPELGPLVSGYPLSSNDIEICIKFQSYFGLYVDKAYIHWMVLQDGRSYFYAFDLTNEFNIWDRDCECWHERVEPYYKSRQIIMIERAAEKAYQEKHPKPKSLFSSDRYQGSLETNSTDVATEL